MKSVFHGAGNSNGAVGRALDADDLAAFHKAGSRGHGIGQVPDGNGGYLIPGTNQFFKQNQVVYGYLVFGDFNFF